MVADCSLASGSGVWNLKLNGALGPIVDDVAGGVKLNAVDMGVVAVALFGVIGFAFVDGVLLSRLNAGAGVTGVCFGAGEVASVRIELGVDARGVPMRAFSEDTVAPSLTYSSRNAFASSSALNRTEKESIFPSRTSEKSWQAHNHEVNVEPTRARDGE